MPRLVTGSRLNREWGANARHALYREDGRWFHVLERFPGALFDAHGYIVFQTENERSGSARLDSISHFLSGSLAVNAYAAFCIAGRLSK